MNRISRPSWLVTKSLVMQQISWWPNWWVLTICWNDFTEYTKHNGMVRMIRFHQYMQKNSNQKWAWIASSLKYVTNRSYAGLDTLSCIAMPLFWHRATFGYLFLHCKSNPYYDKEIHTCMFPLQELSMRFWLKYQFKNWSQHDETESL